MTGELRVRIECYFLGAHQGQTLTTVVGNVFAVSDGNPSERDVLIPAGWEATPASFPLPAGRYVVQAELPSGQVLSEETEVADGAAASVELDLADSPFESHALHFLLGDIEPGAVYHGTGSYPVPNSDGSRSFDRRPGATGSPPSVTGPTAEVAVLLRPQSVPARIDALADLRRLPPLAAISNAAAVLAAPTSERVPLFQPDLVSPIYRFDDRLGDRQSESNRFQYVTVSTRDDAYLVTVPWPWRGVSAVDVLVNQRQSPTGSPVSVAVHHTAIGGGLGYLAAGALDKAATLFGDAERMLWGKVRDPLGAAAGAYVLIGTERSGLIKNWDEWLGNLRDWFPDLSDGAILWGARQLRTARTPTERDEARDALLEGYRRGLPLFTLGLSWLIEGLSAFPGDAECEAAALATRRLCWQVDMREPFVVLRLGGAR